MAAVPSCPGWKSDDWQMWFERLVTATRERLICLRDGEGNAAKHVHQIRKILKRLRMGTRLLRGLVDRDCLVRQQLVFRDMARLLAGSRDGTMRLRTFDSLLGSNERKTKGQLAEMRLKLATEAARGEAWAGEGAEDALRLLDEVGIPRRFWFASAGKGEVRAGLRRLLKKARGDYRDVASGRSQEFHELRKRVKDLFYALEALPGTAKGARKRALSSLKALQETLGLQNDVFVLRAWVAEQGYGPADCPVFWKAAERRDKKLRKMVLEEGAILEELVDSRHYRKAFASGD